MFYTPGNFHKICQHVLLSRYKSTILFHICSALLLDIGTQPTLQYFFNILTYYPNYTVPSMQHFCHWNFFTFQTAVVSKHIFYMGHKTSSTICSDNTFTLPRRPPHTKPTCSFSYQHMLNKDIFQSKFL